MNQTTLNGRIILSIFCGAIACGDSENSEGPDENQNPEPGGQRITTESEANGLRSTVDATEAQSWVYMDFGQEGVEVSVSDPSSELAWDLGFRRSNIRINGGDAGPGQGGVVPVFGISFEAIQEVPSEGWIVDEQSGETDPDEAPVMSDGFDFAFTRENTESPNGWFHYDASTHVLSPAEIVWVIRGAGGEHYALEIIDWYDSFGTSGVFTFRWKALEP